MKKPKPIGRSENGTPFVLKTTLKASIINLIQDSIIEIYARKERILDIVIINTSK